MLKKIFITISISIFSLNASANYYADLNKKVIKFDKYAEKSFQDWKIPGMAIAIVDDQKIVYMKTFGEKQINTGKKIDKNTIFRLASLSKGMTAELIGKLEEKGKLSFNSKVADIIDDFKLKTLSQTYKVQVKHLLSHTTGLSKYTLSKFIETDYTYNELKEKLPSQDILCNPGKCFSYQNFLYSIAGEAAAKASNKNFNDLIRDEIFTPLKMINSTSGAYGYASNDNKALPHLYNNSKYNVSSKDIISTYYQTSPAAGINSSISDMAIWLKAQFGGYPDIISTEVLARVRTPYILSEKIDKNNQENWKSIRLDSIYYGLGWKTTEYAGKTKVVFHEGLLNGFTNIIAFLPEYNVGIVILTNSASPVSNFLAARFLDEYLNLELIDYSKEKLKTYTRW